LIKTHGLDAAGVGRVPREARAMASVGEHPNIVTVYDVGEESGQPYIVSQYMTGGDLAQLLAREHRLATDQALRIADQVCRELEQNHASPVAPRHLNTA